MTLQTRDVARDPVPRPVITFLVATFLLVALLAWSASTAVSVAGVARRSTQPSNGNLPAEMLVEVAGVRLAPAAADALAQMIAAAEADGVTVAVTDGYRTYDQQVELKARKGHLAARPGTSQHGWGVAVDFNTNVTDMAWLRENAAAYGWVHPEWARPGGSKPEPWHWEYVGPNLTVDTALDHDGQSAPEPEPPSAPAPADGDLVATGRLEPRSAPPGAWFTVYEGLDGLDDGARHYPGTALPGETGNTAIAGYRHRGPGPLRGLDELAVEDHIRLRTPEGDDLLYEVVHRETLDRDGGWAVGPDPLDAGDESILTVTTSSDGDHLEVVWARPVADE